MNILFLIRSLGQGGAERQLVCLANGLAARGHGVHVAVFYGGGALEQDLRGPGLHCLDKAGRWDLAGFFLRLVRLVRRLRPDLLHGYLGTANVLSLPAALAAPGVRTVWGLRASDMDLTHYGWAWRASSWLEAVTSPLAGRILVNSQAGIEAAAARGFPRRLLVHVPNGIDTARFASDPEAGRRVRRQWGVADQERLLGLVARLDPMKDHATFLRAAALAVRERADLRFVCVGGGDSALARELERLAGELGLAGRLIWAGPRSDMVAVYSALDGLCLSSAFGEGFPNAVGEAMSCGLACAVTDVGDAARIVGGLGLVVPPGDSEALARAMLGLCRRREAEGPELGRLARERVLELFSLERLVERSEALLLETLGPIPRP